ncbi:MAG: hypothetical protein ACLP8A_05230 [Methylovirgula sp.]
MTTSPLGSEYLRAGPAARGLLLQLLARRQRFWAKIIAHISARPKPRITIVLSPWHNCPVAYFTLIIGAALARQTSVEIHFLIDDIAYPAPNPIFDSELTAIEEMCANCQGAFHIERLSQLPISDRSEDRKVVEDVAKQAVEYDLSHRLGNGIMSYPPPDGFSATAVQQLVSKGLRLIRLWKDRAGDAVLLPGGLVNGSWIYSNLAARSGMRRATFDSGEGTLYLALDGIASQQPDNAKTYAELLNAGQEQRDFALTIAREIRAKREFQGDKVMKVKFDREGVETYDLLLCMSCEGDTAALGLDYIFNNVGDWLESTTIEMNKRRPGIRIAVRQHPDERIVLSHQSKDALGRLQELKAEGANVVIFDAHSDISTYELSRRSKVVIVGATTFGIEATMLGLPVIVFRNSYYAAAGFVQRPDDRSDYFGLIEEALAGKRTPTTEQKDNAHLMYYILEACNRIRVGLTPQPQDFLAWLQADPLTSMESDDFKAILGTIAGEAPYALRKHEKRWQEHLKKAT